MLGPILFISSDKQTQTKQPFIEGTANAGGEILLSLIAGFFCFFLIIIIMICSFPGACETNSTPRVIQAQLISH